MGGMKTTAHRILRPTKNGCLQTRRNIIAKESIKERSKFLRSIGGKNKSGQADNWIISKEKCKRSLEFSSGYHKPGAARVNLIEVNDKILNRCK